MREPADYSAEFAERLARLGWEPVLIGALAANMYRVTPRFTTDVDFLVRSLVGLAEALRREGFEVVELADAGDDPHTMFVRGSGVRVDLLAAQTDYQQLALDRARDGVLSVEDVIVHKLIAWRSRDRDDVDQILAGEPDLDVGYVERWASAWGVGDRWSEVRRR